MIEQGSFFFPLFFIPFFPSSPFTPLIKTKGGENSWRFFSAVRCDCRESVLFRDVARRDLTEVKGCDKSCRFDTGHMNGQW